MKKKSGKYLEYSENLKVLLAVFNNHISDLIFEVESASEDNYENDEGILEEIDTLANIVDSVIRESFDMGVNFAKKNNLK